MSPAQLHSLIQHFPPQSDEDRAATLDFIRTAPLIYGPWQSFKSLYKRAEATLSGAALDAEILGALIARLDAAPLHGPASVPSYLDSFKLGSIAGVAVQSNRLFLSAGSEWQERQQKLHVFDISDPFSPARLGAALARNAGHVTVSATLVCISRRTPSYADQLVKFTFIDVSDPTNPRPVGAWEPGNVTGLALSGHYLYLTEQPGALEGLSAEALAAIAPQFRHGRISLAERRPNVLKVIDISNPMAPRLITTLEVPDARDVAVVGHHAFVTAGRVGFSWTRLPKPGGLRVVDIADPAQPRLVGSLDLGDAQNVVVDDGRAYMTVSGRNAGLRIVDIRDPAHPRLGGTCKVESPLHLAVQSGSAFVLSQSEGLVVVDVSDPAAPRRVAVVALGYLYDTETVSVSGDFVFVRSSYQGLRAFNVANPAKPIEVGKAPSAATMGYVKRRARRLLKRLAHTAPERYVEMACRVLLEAGRDRQEIDLATQWVSLDILYGASDRYRQKRHGRGAYVLAKPSLHRTRRTERAAAAWTARPDLARQLFVAGNLPWQTAEAALRMLRAAGAEIPATNPELLGRFLQSPSPLLLALAVRRVAALLDARARIAPGIVADAYFSATGRRRHALRELLPNDTATEGWSRKFAERLFKHAIEQAPGGRLTRRQASAASLLAEEFGAHIPLAWLLPRLGALLDGGPQTEAWAILAVRRDPVTGTLALLQVLQHLPAARRDGLLEQFLEGVRSHNFPLEAARALVRATAEWMGEASWKVLAASATDAAVLRQIWLELLDTGEGTVALRTALASPHALACLDRARIAPSELATRLRDRPALLALLTPEVFARVSSLVPPGVLVQLIAAVPADNWGRIAGGLREPLLQSLRDPARLAAFWTAVFEQLDIAPGGAVAERILAEPGFSQTFTAVDAVAFETHFITAANPQTGPLLLAWLRAHAALAPKDGPLLLAVATHALPEVRDWGLGRARALGFGLAFALRLLESELPAPVAVGQEFLEKARHRDQLDYVLALCDSPQASVRRYGLEFLSRRAEILPLAAVLPRLFENPNPEIQAWVAAQLRAPDADANVVVSTSFDRVVLRTRNRSRRAKETVQQRLAAAPATALPDAATLLEMARGRTPRDAEWALAQLARLAQAGHVVEGLEVDEVVGI